MEKRVFIMYRTPFELEEFLRLKRTQCGSVEELLTVYPSIAEDEELMWILKDTWDSIPQVSIKEAFEQPTDARKRCYFDHIGVVRMMSTLDKELIDTYVHHEENPSGAYELYKVDTAKLGLVNSFDFFAAVRMWCPSTYKEHWLWVDHREDFVVNKPSAKEAIAWCCQSPYDVKDIKSIHRQGEVFIFEHAPDAKPLKEPIHLKAEDYFRLLQQET